MDETIDNQQAILTAYIAGLMEGEGSFIITKHKYKKWWNYKGMVMFTNTDPDLIEIFIRFLKKNGIKMWIRTDDRRKRNRRICYSVVIKQMKARVKFIDIILPYLRSQIKRKLAKIVRDFTLYRMKENLTYVRDEKGRFINGGHKKQTEIDQRFYEEYKAARKSSETINRTPQRFG